MQAESADPEDGAVPDRDASPLDDGAAPEVLALAKVVARLRSEIASLEALASTAAVLERAKGVLMARTGASAEEAYEALVAAAEEQGRTLMEQCWITLGQGRSRPAPEPAAPRVVLPSEIAEPRGSVFSSARYLPRGGRAVGVPAVVGGGPDPRRLLAGLAGRLADARTADDVADFLCDAVSGDLGIEGLMIYALTEAGRLELVGHTGIDRALVGQWRDIPPLANIAALDAIAGARPVWLEDAAADAERYQLIGDNPGRWPSRAWIPLSGADGTADLVVGFFRGRPGPFDGDTRTVLCEAAALCAGPLRAVRRPLTVPVDEEVAAIQAVFEALPGTAILLSPLRAPTGEVEDYLIEAAAPGSVDVAGRRGKELIGRRVLETYPTVAGTALWQGYLDALTTGTTYVGEPFSYQEVVAGVPEQSSYSVRATRLGGRLVVTWIRHDVARREARRLAAMQRLGNLGWADWNLTTNTIQWSDQVYAIFHRDPARGPMTLEELPEHLLPDDLPALAADVERLLRDGAPIDRKFRVVIPDGVRHLRIVAEAETDADGTPVEVHGFFQDLTAQRDAELALRESERAVLVQRGMLQAERTLAARLQHALLPTPERSMELAGLRVDVAYLPTDSGVNVGGDWYSAIELPDHSALFVVGDVAGHGLDAVGTMAQLRFTAKGMIVTGSALADALTRLNTLLIHTPPDGFGTSATATMIMARYRPEEHRLSWVRAGHLPPLLVRDGRARYLPLPEGGLLGAAFASVYEEVTLRLEPGDHLLLYTDGLIEVPGESIDRGLERLARAAVETVGGDRPEPLARLLAELRPGRRDDVCVLDIHLPADAGPPADRTP
ncbi:SpoIIE family protein phosphatase [Streptomyces sp. A1136]|uniref:SpoIIE family protein phosphatase n=2 Tax=unclassified Streptomyces TaxID=2593676 RepID=UPI001F0FBF09|nr:SpoIIE family protein phosphatase [Streptomyces sp. A1136]